MLLFPWTYSRRLDRSWLSMYSVDHNVWVWVQAADRDVTRHNAHTLPDTVVELLWYDELVCVESKECMSRRYNLTLHWDKKRNWQKTAYMGHMIHPLSWKCTTGSINSCHQSYMRHTRYFRTPVFYLMAEAISLPHLSEFDNQPGERTTW